MTKEEKLENISKVEKKLEKLEKEGYKLLAQLKYASEYNGLAQEYAEIVFSNFVEWVRFEMSSKRNFVHKFDK